MAIRLVSLSELARGFTRKNQLLLAHTAWIQQLRPVSIPFLPSIRSVHIQTTARSEKRKLWGNYSIIANNLSRTFCVIWLHFAYLCCSV